MPRNRPPTPDRLAWVDATRSMCVVGVVLFHVCLWWYLPMLPTAWPPAEDAWATLNGYLGSVRMPLLLAVSGLVASRRIRIGLADGGLAARVAANAYLYVVWLLVYALLYAFVPGGLPHRVDGPVDAATDLVVPETTLWYLYALPLYSVALAAVRRVPPGVVLAGLAVVSVASRVLLGDGPGMWPRILELAFFFALGVHGAAALRAFADRVTVGWTGGCAALALATTLAGRLSDAEPFHGLLFLARGTAFLVTTVAVVVVLVRWAPLRTAAGAVGRRTLPIYVLHVPLVAAVIVATRGFAAGAVADAAAEPVVALALPVLVTSAVVVLCMTAERALVAAGAGALFRMPDGLRGAVAGARGAVPEGRAESAPAGEPVVARG